jgi:hypothetical protein
MNWSSEYRRATSNFFGTRKRPTWPVYPSESVSPPPARSIVLAK